MLKLPDPRLRRVVDDHGDIPPDEWPAVEECKRVAESIAFKMIGCTLWVRENPFILSSLEIYYGPIGDEADDWYRHLRTTKRVERASISSQVLGGPRVYLAHNSLKSTYRRMDIVIGGPGVACSLLIRNVRRHGVDLGGRDGSPCVILRPQNMNVLVEDQAAPIGEGQAFRLEDTHEHYVRDPSCILRRKRFTRGKGYCGFSGLWGQELWNYTLIPESHTPS